MASPVILVNPAGIPEPSPMIQRRLREVHSGLSLRLMDMDPPTWAVCMAWSPEDRRWAWVQTEQYDPKMAYDIIGYLPLDCTPDEAPSYLSRMMRSYPRQDVQHMADALSQYNSSVVAAAADHAIGEVLDSANPSTERRGRGRPRKVS